MKRVLVYITVFFLQFCYVSTNAQCGLEGGIFINEVGNIGNDGAENVREFIELVVFPDIINPNQPVNLEGWIIDDNNDAAVNVGNEPGHIVLGSCFSSVPPGTIILIYNDASTFDNINPNNDIMDEGDEVWQVPISSDCIRKISGCPTHNNSNYDCAPSAPDPDAEFNHYNIWHDYIPMRNLGDLIQVRNPNQDLIHAISWIENTNLQGALFFEINTSQSTKFSIQLTSFSDWFDVNNYSVVESESASPGLPNSSDNEDLINQIFSGESEGLFSNSVFLVCGSPQPSSDNNGEIQLYIDSGVSPFQVEWSGASSGQEQLQQYEYELLLEDLPSGNYQITVTDNRGCSSTCSTDVIPLNISTGIGADENEICEGECQDIGSDLPNGMCYYWSLEHDFDDNTQQIQNVCPIENTNYSITVTDDDGNVIEIREYPVEVTPTETLIYPNPAMLCSSPEGLTLSVDGDWSQYEWSTEETTETIEVFSTGLYSVTVSNDDGCVATAEVEVKDPTQLPEVIEEYFSNLGFIILPIISLDEPGLAQEFTSSTCPIENYTPNYEIYILDQYIPSSSTFDSNTPINFLQELNNICNDNDVTYYLTNNDDFCNPLLIEQIEGAMASNNSITWYHIFDTDEPKLIVGSNHFDFRNYYLQIEELAQFVPQAPPSPPPNNGQWQDLDWETLHSFAVDRGIYAQYSHWTPYITRMGRIIEATVQSVLIQNKYRNCIHANGHVHYGSPCPSGYRQPDFASDLFIRDLNVGNGPDVYWWWERHKEPAMYNEVKISRHQDIRLFPTYNPNQISDFISSLNHPKKGQRYNGVWAKFFGFGTEFQKNPASENVATLQLITLSSNSVENAIANAAIPLGVRIYHSTLEYRQNGNDINVRIKYPGEEKTTNFPFPIEDSGIENLFGILGVTTIAIDIPWYIR